jgi:hypothetical protein
LLEAEHHDLENSILYCIGKLQNFNLSQEAGCPSYHFQFRISNNLLNSMIVVIIFLYACPADVGGV